MLVTGSDILVAARAGKYGVGSFNTNNMEITQAIIHTAEKLRSPVLVQMSEGAIKYGGQDLANIVKDIAESRQRAGRPAPGSRQQLRECLERHQDGLYLGDDRCLAPRL